MTHWNYRVIRFFVDESPHYAIHEVFYGDDGKPSSYGENPAVAMWEWDEDVSGIVILDMMREAFKKPVLTPEDFKNG